jgi:hypothetical protein
MELRTAALVLSDISGYTKFLKMHTMSLLHAEKIITELMEAVIDSSRHPLTLYKLEGDALLFYAFAESPTDIEEHREVSRDVLNQALAFFEAFRTTADQLIGCNVCPCDACRQVGGLRLKSILHFGEVAFKKIRGLEEIAGQEVILTETFYDLCEGHGLDIDLESRTENCEDIGPVPVMVYYPSPAPPPSPRQLLPTLYNAARLDAYGFLRTLGLKGGPSPAVESAIREACDADSDEEDKAKTGPGSLWQFVKDGIQGLGLLLRGKGN